MMLYTPQLKTQSYRGGSAMPFFEYRITLCFTSVGYCGIVEKEHKITWNWEDILSSPMKKAFMRG